MMFRASLAAGVLVLILSVGLVSCIGVGDALKRGHQLPGGYWLEEAEDMDYYITRDGPQPLLGVLNGRITQVGWNSELIVAWREGSRAPAGWMVIDVHNGRIVGPLSSATLQDMRTRAPALAGVQIHPVQEAWKLTR